MNVDIQNVQNSIREYADASLAADRAHHKLLHEREHLFYVTRHGNLSPAEYEQAAQLIWDADKILEVI